MRAWFLATTAGIIASVLGIAAALIAAKADALVKAACTRAAALR